jgi:hypothetical protein
MNAGALAALIAAGFWAVLVCAAVYLLVRLARLAAAADRLLGEYSRRAGSLLDRADAAVAELREQASRTAEITGSMRQLSAGAAELGTQVSALAQLTRNITAGLGVPLARIPALLFGVRHALALRVLGRRARGQLEVTVPADRRELPGADRP